MSPRDQEIVDDLEEFLPTKSGRKLSRWEWRVSLGLMLGNEHLRGDIILLAISMEQELDSFLARYFCRVGRCSEFHEHVLPILGFAQKIELFSSLRFRRTIKSHPELCLSFSMLRRLRNHCAHAYALDGEKVAKLADNQHVREFLTEYPTSVPALARKLRRLFSALERTKEFSQDGDIEPDIPW